MDCLFVKLNTPTAKVPTRGSPGAIGYDLYADLPDCMDGLSGVVIPAGERARIDLGFSMALPHGTYGRIAPRSGLASKHGIDVMAGVIDKDYRGPMQCILINHGKFAFLVKHGDRIAQLILEQAITPPIVQCEALDDTERGQNGLGSTGIQ